MQAQLHVATVTAGQGHRRRATSDEEPSPREPITGTTDAVLSNICDEALTSETSSLIEPAGSATSEEASGENWGRGATSWMNAFGTH